MSTAGRDFGSNPLKGDVRAAGSASFATTADRILGEHAREWHAHDFEGASYREAQTSEMEHFVTWFEASGWKQKATMQHQACEVISYWSYNTKLSDNVATLECTQLPPLHAQR